MSILTPELIALHASAKDKKDAIRQAGALLVNAGCVRPAYVNGMLAREESMSTSLGIGVAIPHGIYENKDDILKTGISFLQLSAPVEWEEGDEVRVVIGIAAQGEEHVGVLANLAEVIEDEAILEELAGTLDPAVVLKYLNPAE